MFVPKLFQKVYKRQYFMNKIFFFIVLFLFLFSKNFALAEKIKDIIILGNDRIPNETIIMFSGVNINDDIDDNQANKILKDLYDSNFFEDISVSIDSNILTIKVNELPIIDNIIIEGIKAEKIEENIRSNLTLKPRSSLNKIILKEEESSIKTILKNLGYYFSQVETYLEDLDNNLVNVRYKIDLGEKAKIKKITFIGDKIYKDKVLRNVIISEEYKFWKFISGKKFLNENMIEMDKRLLKNFYLNKGFYDVRINSSFAKLISEDGFELIYNITPNNKIYFNNLNVIYPDDIDETNYESLSKVLSDLKGKPYSLNSVRKILEEIDFITVNEEYKSIKATLEEKIVSNKLNIDFIIEETEKKFIERINIFGNNITQESVIRNQLALDEGDPFNEILAKKSENNLKSLNFFKDVKTKVSDGESSNTKIIDIFVEEKPTGEIFAGAGAGTGGGTAMFGVKENNYLGKGLSVDANATISAEQFRGLISVTNPNFKNSDKTVFGSLQATETDRLSSYGYKTNKTGFEVGTKFEYLRDFDFGISTSSYYEKIETDSTASTRQKSQEGDYWDTFVNADFSYDKRNQKYKPSEGYISNFTIDVPLISKTNTLTNSYNYKVYSELYENNITSFSFYLKSATSLTGNDIKLSERLTIPSRRLRGFEFGKVGPKDGNDFIGGNYVSTLNISSTLPQVFPNLQNLDISVFLDAANVWGVDYDSSLSDSSKLRSSLGLGVEWFTPVGPLTFSFSEVITKDINDIEESFRFNIGTTF